MCALRTMVPGIRLAGDGADDQARVDTPSGGAIARGADSRPSNSVTGARRPGRAPAAEVAGQVAEALVAGTS